MRKFADSIWIADQNQKFFGIELGARMTVVKLDGGELLVHSPIRPNARLIDDLNALGKVAYVVAPNKWHHLYLSDFRRSFPQARFFCANGLEKKRPDFRFDGVIAKDDGLPWRPQLDHAVVDGVPLYNEVVFFHRRSRTLIVTDLALHIRESRSWATKACLSLLGAYGKFGWSSLEKKMFVKDEVLFKKSLASILNWDFDKIIMAHGTPVETDGKRIFEEAFQGGSLTQVSK